MSSKRAEYEVKTRSKRPPLVLSSFLFSVSLLGSHFDIAVHVGPEFDELCGRLKAIFLLPPCGLAAPVSPAKPADPGQAGQFDSLSKAHGTWKSCSTAPKYQDIRAPQRLSTGKSCFSAPKGGKIVLRSAKVRGNRIPQRQFISLSGAWPG